MQAQAKFKVKVDGRLLGPMTEDQIFAMLGDVLKDETPVQKDGDELWSTAGVALPHLLARARSKFAAREQSKNLLAAGVVEPANTAALPTRDANDLVQAHSATPSPETEGSRSEWSSFLRLLGWVCLGVSVWIWFVIQNATGNYFPQVVSMIAMIAAGLNCFFAAFLVDVFTDIRDLLKKLVSLQSDRK